MQFNRSKPNPESLFHYACSTESFRLRIAQKQSRWSGRVYFHCAIHRRAEDQTETLVVQAQEPETDGIALD
jgi:hypothetical protein